MEVTLPPIPAKRYFTIGEVGELCGVKPHVLRYWEQEFTQLRPMKRRGNRRYYQHHEVLMIRRIRELLYDQGFTINGARNKLQELAQQERELKRQAHQATNPQSISIQMGEPLVDEQPQTTPANTFSVPSSGTDWRKVRQELLAIRNLLPDLG